MSQARKKLTIFEGIGLAIARFLLEEKPFLSNIVVTARSKGPLEDLKKEFPGNVEIITADAADFSAPQRAVDLAKEKFGGLDGLVVNHGVLDPVKTVAEANIEEWRKHFDINFFSVAAYVSYGRLCGLT